MRGACFTEIISQCHLDVIFHSDEPVDLNRLRNICNRALIVTALLVLAEISSDKPIVLQKLELCCECLFQYLSIYPVNRSNLFSEENNEKQRKHQSSASLAIVRGIQRWPVISSNKGPVTRKCFHWMTSSCSLMSQNRCLITDPITVVKLKLI